MADTKIKDLPLQSSVGDDDYMVGDTGSTTYKFKSSVLKANYTAEISEKTAEAIESINTEAERIKSSFPTDYSTLTNDVSTLKGRATDLETRETASENNITNLQNNVQDLNSMVYDTKLISHPTNTASGEIVTFKDGGENVPVKDLTLHLEPHQNLNSYDHAWIGGYGKNKFNRDGEDIGYFLTSEGRVSSSDGWTVSDYIPVSASTQYVFQPNTTAWSSAKHVFFDADKVFIDYIDSGFQTFTTPSNCAYMRFSYRTTSSNIQLEIGDTSTTYEPYENICPITGYDSVNLYKTGKNILPPLYESNAQNGITYDVQSDGSIHVYGTATKTSYFTGGTSGFYMYLPEGFYSYYRGDSASGVDMYIVFQNVATGDRSSTAHDTGSGKTREFKYDVLAKLQLSVSQNTTVDCVVYPMLVRSENVADAMQYEPYKGTTYPISFSSSGTVYGGTLDVTSGELVVNYVKHVLDGTVSGWSGISTNDNIYIFSRQRNSLWSEIPVGINNGTVLCDKLKPVSALYAGQHEANAICIYDDHSNYIRIALEFEDKSSITSAYIKEWLTDNPVTVVYEITEPITYQLTPTEVTTLLGYNIIWMDADGTMDVVYRADATIYFDEKSKSIKMLIAPVEDDYKATRNYTVGSYVIVKDTLYKVTTAIVNGGTITPNSNVTATTVMDQIMALA